MSTNSEQLALLDSHIRDIPDFPKPGIIFKDITPLLSNAAAFTVAVDMLAEHLCDSDIDFIACPEARGFIWAAPLAYRLDAGITLIRKPGKLPADTIEYTFDLEYGSDAFSIHADAFAGKPNPSVLIVDDVLATGGTAQATAELVSAAGGKVIGIAVLIELNFLDGRSRLAGLPVTSLLNY
jgi:adenine phosphoribosyltransferase